MNKVTSYVLRSHNDFDIILSLNKITVLHTKPFLVSLIVSKGLVNVTGIEATEMFAENVHIWIDRNDKNTNMHVDAPHLMYAYHFHILLFTMEHLFKYLSMLY